MPTTCTGTTNVKNLEPESFYFLFAASHFHFSTYMKYKFCSLNHFPADKLIQNTWFFQGRLITISVILTGFAIHLPLEYYVESETRGKKLDHQWHRAIRQAFTTHFPPFAALQITRAHRWLHMVTLLMLGTSSLIFYKYTGTYGIIMYTVFEILWSLPVQQISSASEFVIDNVSYQIHQVLRWSESDFVTNVIRFWHQVYIWTQQLTCNISIDLFLAPPIRLTVQGGAFLHRFQLCSKSPRQHFVTTGRRYTHTHRHTMGSLLFLSHPTITTSQFKPLVVLILQSKCSWSGTIKTLQLYDQRLYWSLYREAV